MKTFPLIGRRPGWVSALSVLCVALIFFLDLSTPLGWAEWLLYLLPIVASSYELSRSRLMLLTFTCSVLVVVAYFFTVHGGPSGSAPFNRFLVITTFWVVAIVMSSRNEAVAGLARAKEELETRVEERTAELSSANDSLTAEAERRKKLEKEKTDFLAMVSHDMKSPLSVITGYAELIASTRRGSLDAETLSMVEGISNSSGRLLRMVEDFVAVSKIESGRLQPNRLAQPVPLALAEAAKSGSVIANNKGLEYSYSLPDASVRAELDWGLVQRAVANLIENALNYTPADGRVGMSVRQEGGELVIEVSDTGPGIAPEERELVFEKYFRSSRTSRVKGTGLGLAIVKAVAEAHGGRVELDSEVGKGSTFRMVFPGQPL